MKTFAMAAAAIVLAFTAQPAFASTATAMPATAPQHMTATVSLAGIDLASPAGQKLADQRIRAAARKVCRVPNIAFGGRMMSHEVRSCLAKARASASQQLAAITADGAGNWRRGG